jgi:hypothetical protein
MRDNKLRTWQLLAMLLVVPALALSQAGQQRRTLSISGYTGQAPVVQMNGRSYIDLESLAQLTNGSLSFNGNQITLALQSASTTASTTAAPASHTPNSVFSKEFMRAGIEVMSEIREWRTALTNAIERGYPISDEWLSPYRVQAAESLRLASVAVNTDADRDASQLVTNEFENMRKLSNQYVKMREQMIYIDPDSMKKDPLDQKIITCARALAAMGASGQFVDDGSCR